MWEAIRIERPVLQRTHSYLSQGTRSSKKVSRVDVFHSGLFIDKQHPYLEASPDRTQFVKVIT